MGGITNFFEDLGIGDINDIGRNFAGMTTAFITGGPAGLGLFFAGNIAVSRGVITKGSAGMFTAGLGSFFNVTVGGEKQGYYARKALPVLEARDKWKEHSSIRGLFGWK